LQHSSNHKNRAKAPTCEKFKDLRNQEIKNQESVKHHFNRSRSGRGDVSLVERCRRLIRVRCSPLAICAALHWLRHNQGGTDHSPTQQSSLCNQEQGTGADGAGAHMGCTDRTRPSSSYPPGRADRQTDRQTARQIDRQVDGRGRQTQQRRWGGERRDKLHPSPQPSASISINCAPIEGELRDGKNRIVACEIWREGVSIGAICPLRMLAALLLARRHTIFNGFQE